jgi:hypothetical protein
MNPGYEEGTVHEIRPWMAGRYPCRQQGLEKPPYGAIAGVASLLRCPDLISSMGKDSERIDEQNSLLNDSTALCNGMIGKTCMKERFGAM